MNAAGARLAIPQEPAWTDEQWDAITARDCDLLVSAAAGAGKTAVLVRRVISRVVDPVSPVEIDRMLVVTFTDAAAAEMKDRIASSLGRLLSRNPTNARLARQIALLGKADISTIHSFCHKVIRRYFYRVDIDPVFRVMDEVEAELVRLEVMEEVLERAYADQGFQEAFVALVDRYGGPGGDSGLRDLVLRIHRYSRSRPSPAAWFRRMARAFDIPEGASLDALPWTRTALEGITRSLSSANRRLKEAMELAGSGDGLAAYLPILQAESAACSEALEACRDTDWARVADAVGRCVFQRLPATRLDGPATAARDRVKALRAQAKGIISGMQGSCFTRPAGEIVEELRAVGPNMQTLIRCVEEFDTAYASRKQAAGLLDFSDLEHVCLKVLLSPDSGDGEPVPSDAALEIAGRYEEILVDEYQDINPVQDAILTLVSRGRNVFMVGDVKQSIYRFRLAEPGLFMRKYREYSKERSSACRRIDLSANFRSRRTVIDAVNFVFRQVLAQGAAEVDYDRESELVYGADYPPCPDGVGPCGPVEFHLIERRAEAAPAVAESSGTSPHEEAPHEEEEGLQAGDGARAADGAGDEAGTGEEAPSTEELEALEIEGRLVASRIARMVRGTASRPGPEFLVWDRDRGAYRPVSYRDIVVLLRATRERANVLLEVFRDAGIPAYAELGTGYFEATEIELMVSLLRVIDNPRQDIPLAAVLRSPIFGLSPDELARVRLCRPDGDFCDALADASSREELGALAGKAREFLDRLEGWRTLARRVPLSTLVWRLYRDTRYLDYVGGMPGGAQRQANLRALHERARQFDRFSKQGLFRFVRFVDRLRESQGDLGTARALGEAEDVVRVMSVHRSKGLEFPVVFVADLGKGFNLQDIEGDILFHSETGLGPVFCDPVRRIKYPTLAHLATRERRRAEALAEELRILYVALTRAKEKLVMVGSARDLAKRAQRWCDDVSRRGWGLSEEYLVSAGSLLDWIAGALARHAGGGSPIRALAMMEGASLDPVVASDAARFEVKVWPAAAGRHEQAAMRGQGARETSVPLEDIARARPIDREVAPELRRAIEAHVRWTYPFAALTGLAAKVAWPELKRRFESLPDDAEVSEGGIEVGRPARIRLADRPRFMRAIGVTAAERGQAMHLVIQHLDLSVPLTVDGISSTVRSMVAADLLAPELEESIDVGAIAKFFASPLGRRVVADPLRVRREVPFCVGIEAKRVYQDLPPEVAGNERVVVQGMIDCLVDEGDGFVLVDFKTDAQAWASPDMAAHAHAGQIAVYAAAVRRIHRRPVKEAYLYFLGPGLPVRVDLPAVLRALSWDDDGPPPDDVAEPVDDRLDLDGEIP